MDKKYVVKLTQVGSAAPVATEIRNNLGTVVWTRGSAGVYTATLADAFDPVASVVVEVSSVFTVVVNDEDSITLTVSGGDGTLSGTLLELVVYSATASSPSAQAYDIINLDRVKDFLNIPVATTDDDDFIQTWISQFSLEIEDEIQNKVKSQTVTDEIGSGNGRYKFRPRYFPIISLTSAKYLDDTTWTDIEDDVADIIINSPKLSEVSAQNSHNLELTESVWSEGTQNIKLTYQAGWSTIPSALSLVCLEKVVELYRNSSKSGGGRFGLQSFSINEGGGSKNTTYKDFTARHKKMLDPYRRPY